RLASFVEEALSATQDKRIDEQPEFVDQAGRQQGAYQAGTAVDHDVLPGLLFQLRDFGRKIALDQMRIVPRELLQGPRRDELRHAVELVREPVGVFPAGPSRGEPLIRHSSQEERVRSAGLVELEVLGLLAPEWEAPLLGRFDDAVQRHTSVRATEDPYFRLRGGAGGKVMNRNSLNRPRWAPPWSQSRKAVRDPLRPCVVSSRSATRSPSTSVRSSDRASSSSRDLRLESRAPPQSSRG